jgi:hypothetical protein
MLGTLIFIKYVIYLMLAISVGLQLNFTMDAQQIGEALGVLILLLLIVGVNVLLVRKLLYTMGFAENFLLLMVLALFLFAYPVKQLWIYYDPSILAIYFYSALMTDLSNDAVLRYLSIQYTVYLMLLMGAYAACIVLPERRMPHVTRPFFSDHAAMLCLVVALLLMVVSLFMMKQFGIYMGGGGIALPFRLAGIIVHTYLVVVPFLLLLAIRFYGPRYNKQFALIIFLLVLIYIAGDMGVRMSRSGLLFTLMLIIGFFVASCSKNIPKFIGIGLISMVVTMFLFPIATAMRMAEVYDNWDSVYFVQQYERASELVFSTIVLRVTGAEMAGVVLSNVDPGQVDNVQLMEEGITQVFTNNVLGHPDSDKTGFTPSALGASYMMFGLYGTFVVAMVFPITMILAHRFMARFYHYTYPIVFAFLFSFCIKAVTGGIFSSQLIVLGLACLGGVMVDFITKKMHANERYRR